jgi:hypothetical protein
LKARRCAFVELEVLEAARLRETVEVLWLITDALANAGVFAPLTLCLYAHYWKKQNAGQEFRLHNTTLKSYLQRSSKHCIRGLEILASSSLGGVLHDIFDVGLAAVKGWSLIEKLWAAARDHIHTQRIADLRGSQPSEWNIERIEGACPEFLAIDIFSHFQTHLADKLPSHRHFRAASARSRL